MNLLVDVVGLSVGYVMCVEEGWFMGLIVVFIGEVGVVVGVDVCGGGLGICEIDLFDLCNLVERVYVVVFIGGSVFGFVVVDGVMFYLEFVGVGLWVGFDGFVVFIVFVVVVFDFGCGGDVCYCFDLFFGIVVCLVGGLKGGVGLVSQVLDDGSIVVVFVVVNVVGLFYDFVIGELWGVWYLLFGEVIVLVVDFDVV